MNLARSLKAVKALALGFLVLCCSAGLAMAQALNPIGPVYQGKFTLLFEVQWGNALLPPGEYSFTLDSKSLPAVVVVRGERKSAVIVAAGVSPLDSSTDTALIIANQGGRHLVRAMRLPTIGLVVSYKLPKAGREEITQASQAIDRVQILGAQR